MSDKDLNLLIDRVAGEEAEAEAEAAAAEAKTDQDQAEAFDIHDADPVRQDMPPVDPMMAKACMMGVGMVSVVFTRRYKVSDLTPEECHDVGLAIAQVAAFYDIAKADPKVMAWVSLGVSVLGVVGLRAMEYEKTIEGEAGEVTEGGEADAEQD